MAPCVEMKSMYPLKINTKGCKNCSASVLHLLQTFCELRMVRVDTESGTVHIPDDGCIDRVVKLLQTSGWRVDRNTTQVLPEPAVTQEDAHFIDPVENNYDVVTKKPRLSDLHVISPEQDKVSSPGQADVTSGAGIASRLVPIHSPETECMHTHWVPGWAVLVRRGPSLQHFYKALNKCQPSDRSTAHLKRIDSCRNGLPRTPYPNTFVPVFLGLSEPGFRFKNAAELIATFTSEMTSRTDQDTTHLVVPQPRACWIPFSPPITRKQQVLYASIPSVHKSHESQVIFGWPTTLRASPEMEYSQPSDCQQNKNASGHPCFSVDELERHNYWLDQVVQMCEAAGETFASCAGHSSRHPNAVIIVDPRKNNAIAKATTPSYDTTVHSRRVSLLDHAVFLAVEEAARYRLADEENTYYLCTGLYAYLAWEPCIMCSMALVHNRIKRVICANRLTFAGGFTNNSRIHTEKRLNHRFEVYAPAE